MRTLRNSTVVVTGGTGSFGQTMVRRLLAEGAAQIRVLSRDEQKQDAMRRTFQDERIRYTLGSVTDMDTVLRVMKGADYVFHAAAHKIVPSVEAQPMPAVATNILGSHVVAQAAIRCCVRGVFLSTDKAVEPVNAMGATKMLMERVIRALDAPLVVTRYGNVMGSRGSVIPVFAEALRAGRPLPVTDPEMTRFLMSLEDAVDLVVEAMAGHYAPGTILVHKAPAATVRDIAEVMIEQHGSGTWETVGVRPGEKKHETLATAEEMAHALNRGRYLAIGRERLHQDMPAYSSDTTRRLTRAELAAYMAKA